MNLRNLILGSLVLCLIAGGLALSRQLMPYKWREYHMRALDLGSTYCSAFEAPEPRSESPFKLFDASFRLGPPRATTTFSLSIADISGDGRDDILIGTHGKDPLLLINSATNFHNASSHLESFYQKYDAHGHTLADIDNDGDLDIAIAGGGADGVGSGSPNMILINQGDMTFGSAYLPETLSAAPARSRSLIPTPGEVRPFLDLYLTALRRPGYPNALFGISPDASKLTVVERQTALPGSVNDRGYGLLANLDDDTKPEYLLLTDNIAKLYGSDGTKTHLAKRVYSASTADLNNDGALDIFLGRYVEPSGADHVTHNDSQLNFVLSSQKNIDSESLSFATTDALVRFNFKQHIRQSEKKPNNQQAIFIGENSTAPTSRNFALTRQEGTGKPKNLQQSGIYVWFDRDSRRWHLHWQFPEGGGSYKGLVLAEQLHDIRHSEMELREPGAIRDLVLINDGQGNFQRLCEPQLEHSRRTVSSTVADLDGDGWQDIITLRGDEHGARSGDIVLLRNIQGKGFAAQHVPARNIDHTQSADLIAHGFFNDDLKPDLIATYGYGQIPGNQGSARLLHNATTNTNAHILIELSATKANRFAIGAQLSLYDAHDTLLGYRVVGANINISQDTYLQHFGVGNATGPFQLRIDWPDGTTSHETLEKPGRYSIIQ